MRLQKYSRVFSDLGNKLLYNSMLVSELIMPDEYYMILWHNYLHTTVSIRISFPKFLTLAIGTMSSFKVAYY